MIKKIKELFTKSLVWVMIKTNIIVFYNNGYRYTIGKKEGLKIENKYLYYVQDVMRTRKGFIKGLSLDYFIKWKSK